MKKVLLLFCICFSIQLVAQSDSQIVRVHFFYGSKPKFKYRCEEEKRFGGLHSGHVSIQIADTIFSFKFKGKIRLFGTKKNAHHHWVNQNLSDWVRDTMDNKYATFLVPLSLAQRNQLLRIQKAYLQKDPYDYAFLGMRCASSVYDVFAQLGTFKIRSPFCMVLRIFYPKQLRKHFFKLAEKNKWEIIRQDGSPKRKWERK